MIDNIKNTEIRDSKIHGKGLFANERIKKETLLCILEGQPIKIEDYFKLLSDSDYSKSSFIEKYKLNEEYICAMPFRTKYSYINHSINPNIYSALKDRKLYVYASKDIEKGEEIVDVYNLKSHIDILGGFKKS